MLGVHDRPPFMIETLYRGRSACSVIVFYRRGAWIAHGGRDRSVPGGVGGGVRCVRCRLRGALTPDCARSADSAAFPVAFLTALHLFSKQPFGFAHRGAEPKETQPPLPAGMLQVLHMPPVHCAKPQETQAGGSLRDRHVASTHETGVGSRRGRVMHGLLEWGRSCAPRAIFRAGGWLHALHVNTPNGRTKRGWRW